MRMRVLTQTSKGKMLAIADRLTKLIEADKDTDVIMPAYPCDGERLLVIVATAKAEMPDSFQRFMRSLKKSALRPTLLLSSTERLRTRRKSLTWQRRTILM